MSRPAPSARGHQAARQAATPELLVDNPAPRLEAGLFSSVLPDAVKVLSHDAGPYPAPKASWASFANNSPAKERISSADTAKAADAAQAEDAATTSQIRALPQMDQEQGHHAGRVTVSNGRDVLRDDGQDTTFVFTRESLGADMESKFIVAPKATDRIDLSELDLRLVSGNAFTGNAGELVVTTKGTSSHLRVDLDGDGRADLEIFVTSMRGDVLDMLILEGDKEPGLPDQPSPSDPTPVDPAPVDPKPQPEPEPIPQPQPDPNPVDPAPQPEPGLATATATVQEDRVTHLEIPEDVTKGLAVTAVRILDQPEEGHVSVLPNNGLALVMSGAAPGTGKIGFSYEVTLADNSVVRVDTKVDLTEGLQKAGWSLGEHYLLETDAADNSVIEHGDNHREVYVSAGSHALSFAEIAQKEGLPVASITGAWLAKHPEYGSSPETALDEKAGIALWHFITGSKAAPSSHWMLLESGHSYDEMGFLVKRGTQGESEMHPVLITAYGEGDRPLIVNAQNWNTPDNHNIVIKGIAFDSGLQIHQGSNYLLEDLSFKHKGFTVQITDGVTLRNSSIIDVFRTESVSEDIWSPHINRISGVFANDVDSLLIEGLFVDHTGWADDYLANLSLEGGQPPSIYSQSLYLSYGNTDLTLRDSILMRGASFGAQVRSGGMIENNVFLDNNAAVNFLGGADFGETGGGNYTLLMGNLITSGAHRDVSAGPRGALTMGIDNSSRMSTLLDNIVTHLANPDDPAELAAKPVGHKPVNHKFDPIFDNTKVFNWAGAKSVAAGMRVDKNVEGLDRNVLDATTIQNFTAELLGKKTATIGDLADFLRAQADGRLDGHVDADIINAFFRTGFGMNTTIRGEADTLRFIPNDLADGVRWDNRLNWSTGDLPGTQDGDSIDLAGNHVRFGATTVTVDDFDFGDFGRLTATSGKLTIEGDIAVGDKGAALTVDYAGQIWIDGYRDSDMLEIDVVGGRFANKGDLVGLVDMHVSDNGQAILAGSGGSLDLTAGSSLTLEGSRIKVGFDGKDGETSVIRMHDGASLSFIADAKGFTTLGEFRSGAFGTSPVIDTAIRLDGRLTVDVSALAAGTGGGTWTLIKADEIVGSFDRVDIVGLSPDRSVTLVLDYDAEEFRFIMGPDTGSGHVDQVVIGGARAEAWSQDTDSLDLWRALHEAPMDQLDELFSW